MIVLTRKRGEDLVIDDGRIVVHVLSVDDRGSVRLGIAPPRDVRVDRREIHEQRLAQCTPGSATPADATQQLPPRPEAANRRRPQ